MEDSGTDPLRQVLPKKTAMIRTIGLMSLAGVAGTLSRFGVAAAFARWRTPFPWGTLIINAVGCFLFGLVATLADERGTISSHTRLVLTTGFLGAFTTFSTYAYESVTLARGDRPGLALANVFGQVALGLALAVIGSELARRL